MTGFKISNINQNSGDQTSASVLFLRMNIPKFDSSIGRPEITNFGSPKIINFGTPKIIDFPFGTNGKMII